MTYLSTRIASLPWYDLPFTKHHLDSVFGSIHRQLKSLGYKDLPHALDRITPLKEQWENSALFLSQCCGPDLRTPAGSSLQVIARPVFNNLDCEPGDYYSHIVAVKNNISATPRIVINSKSSFSGCTALLNWLHATGRNYKHCLISGSHTGSMEKLLCNEADVAAIDAYSWQFIKNNDLTIIDQSASAPAPPFVRHSGCTIDSSTLSKVLDRAFNEHGQRLNLTRLVPADNEMYRQTLPDTQRS